MTPHSACSPARVLSRRFSRRPTENCKLAKSIISGLRLLPVPSPVAPSPQRVLLESRLPLYRREVCSGGLGNGFQIESWIALHPLSVMVASGIGGREIEKQGSRHRLGPGWHYCSALSRLSDAEQDGCFLCISSSNGNNSIQCKESL